MARKAVAAAKMQQLRGKANEIIGRETGDPVRRIKGKLQVAIGKIREQASALRHRKPKAIIVEVETGE